MALVEQGLNPLNQVLVSYKESLTTTAVLSKMS